MRSSITAERSNVGGALRRCAVLGRAAIVGAVAVPLSLIPRPGAATTTSLQSPFFLTVGQGSLQSYLYVSSERGLLVYKRDAADGHLTFVQSLTEDPPNVRCDGTPQMKFVRGITTRDGWVYAANNSSWWLFALQPDSSGRLTVRQEFSCSGAPCEGVYYLAAGASRIYPMFRPGAASYSVLADHTLDTAAATRTLATLDGSEFGSAAVTAAGDLLFVPGHTSNTIVMFHPDSSGKLVVDTTFTGIIGPYWVMPYPADTADHLLVASDAGATDLQRAGTTFTTVGGTISVPGATTLAVSPDGKYVYVGVPAAGTITTLSRDPVGGALGATTFPTQSVPGVLAIAMAPDGKNLYAVSPTTNSVYSFIRNPDTGSLDPLPITDNSAEPAYVPCTMTPTITPTNTPTITPTRTPTMTPTPHDSVVQAKNPIGMSIPLASGKANGPNPAIKIRNADLLDPPGSHQISPTVTSDCPKLLQGSSPAAMTIAKDSVSSLHIDLQGLAADFPLASKDHPTRCRLTIQAVNASGGDRTPWNNATTLEVDVKRAGVASGAAEFYVGAAKTKRLKKSSGSVVIPWTIHNLGALSHPFDVVASLLPPGCPLVAAAPTFNGGNVVGSGSTAKGKVQVTMTAGAFPGATKKSPGRCTLVLTASTTDPGSDSDASNNTTWAVIDVW